MAASGQAALGLGPGEGDPRLENVSGRCITGTAFEIRGDVQGQGTDLTLIANAPDGEVNVRVGPDVPMNAGFGFMYQGDIGALPQPQFIELLLISADESTVFDRSLPTIDWSQCETNEPETNERPTLPATGPSSSSWITLIAGLALIGGTALIAATRRRA
jgi:LPXTG-motif cell wall-anchored protein